MYTDVSTYKYQCLPSLLNILLVCIRINCCTLKRRLFYLFASYFVSLPLKDWDRKNMFSAFLFSSKVIKSDKGVKLEIGKFYCHEIRRKLKNFSLYFTVMIKFCFRLSFSASVLDAIS